MIPAPATDFSQPRSVRRGTGSAAGRAWRARSPGARVWRSEELARPRLSHNALFASVAGPSGHVGSRRAESARPRRGLHARRRGPR